MQPTTRQRNIAAAMKQAEKLDAVIAKLQEYKAATLFAANDGYELPELIAEHELLGALYDAGVTQFDEIYKGQKEVAWRLMEEHGHDVTGETPEAGTANFGAAHPDNPSYLRECAA